MRAKIDGYLKRTGMSISAFAEEVKINRATVSKYLKGDYVSQIAEREIENGYKRVISEEGLPGDGPILSAVDKFEDSPPTPEISRIGELLLTNDAQGVISVCQTCHDYGELGLITGRSGFGKSFSLKFYAKSPSVAYIECNETMTAKDLVKVIERSLSLPHMRGSVDDRMDYIKDFFNANRGYLLIVDEADKLIARYSQRKAEMLRSLFDQSAVGVVLAGEPGLERLICSLMPRMTNRIKNVFRLGGLSKAEVGGYLTGEGFDEEAADEMIRRGCNERNGCFRLLNGTLENVRRIVPEGEVITLDDVRRASAMMMI